MAWVAVGLAVASVITGKKSSEKKKKAARIQQRAVHLQNVRARVQAMKEFRIARAQALTGITSSGADLASSAYQGVKGSLQSQIKENAEFSLEQEALGQQANKAEEQAAKFGFISSALGVGASIAGGASGMAKTALSTTATPAQTNTNLNPSPFIFSSNK